MAINLLPLVLVGGAAVVVVSKEKKKTKDAGKCPPQVAVGFGEWKGIYERAHEKFGQNPDPGPESTFVLNEALPKACSRASINSSVKLTVPGAKTEVVIPIPDMYLLIFDQAAGRRLAGDVATKQQLDEYVNRELDWYKKTTGKNFDPNTEYFQNLMKAMAEMLQAVFEKLAKEGKAKGGLCPKSIDLHAGRGEEMRVIAEALMAGGNKDAFQMADVVFGDIFPDCSKSDYRSIVRVVEPMPGQQDPQPVMIMDLSAFYAGIVIGFSEKLLEKNLIGVPKHQTNVEKMKAEYQKLTGNPLPDVDL